MPRKLDDRIAIVLKDHGFGPDACWDCHGVWVVYHRVLEQIAAKAGIHFAPPQIIEADGANKIATLCATGTLGTKTEWSIGEAAPGNNKNSYPWAMAEKRAKDRVILKLIGLHGLAYSEEEADDFKSGTPPVQTEEPRNKSVRDADWKDGPCKTRGDMRTMFGQANEDLKACNDLDMLAGFERSYEPFFAQLRHNSPTWWDSETDPPGMKQRIERMHKHLAAEDARRTLAA